ncbi:MAG: hypothetical protein ACK5Z2_14170 [Bacteroidota bacterium]|jgi:hypothetical protein
MNVLLSETFTLSTPLTPQEILARLNHYVYKRDNFFTSSGTKTPYQTYEGWYDEEDFKIKRIINYRNSFLPVITGNIVQNGSRSTITVKMAPNLLTKIALPFILIILMMFFFTPNRPKDDLLLNIMPWIVSVIFIAVITITTYYEIRKAKKDLIKYFDAELVYS